MERNKESETSRLEMLWLGKFGNDYIERNRKAGDYRGPFWIDMLNKFSFEKVLEVGCNIGANIKWIKSVIQSQNIYGVDINRKALGELHVAFPDVNALLAPARELPFRDNWFDLVFTMGVLIHQPEESLLEVMREMVRCSKKYIMCAEYFSEKTQELLYRNQRGALFKRNYPKIFLENFPQLELVKEGFLTRKERWDDASYWVFSKPKI